MVSNRLLHILTETSTAKLQWIQTFGEMIYVHISVPFCFQVKCVWACCGITVRNTWSRDESPTIYPTKFSLQNIEISLPWLALKTNATSWHSTNTAGTLFNKILATSRTYFLFSQLHQFILYIEVSPRFFIRYLRQVQCDPFIWKNCNFQVLRIIFSNQIYNTTPPKSPMGYISFMLKFFVRWTVWPWQSKNPHF